MTDTTDKLHLFLKLERIVWDSRFQILDTVIVPAQADLTVFIPASTLTSFYFIFLKYFTLFGRQMGFK